MSMQRQQSGHGRSVESDKLPSDGNILYRFPSLQRTATPQRSGQKDYIGRSKTSESEKAMVIGLGGLNLFGVVILGTMLKNMAVTPSGFISFVSSIFPLLQLLSARDMAPKTFIGQDRIVYSTERDLYEQDYEAQEWERRFKQIENSD